ncbi:hypothetical protein LY76DRAFT_398727 [Colletotrichum caudatum]|nr:hypothetical protein LY76DRAFT_398727 [Colletotrichum caudatum]
MTPSNQDSMLSRFPIARAIVTWSTVRVNSIARLRRLANSEGAPWSADWASRLGLWITSPPEAGGRNGKAPGCSFGHKVSIQGPRSYTPSFSMDGASFFFWQARKATPEPASYRPPSSYRCDAAIWVICIVSVAACCLKDSESWLDMGSSETASEYR